MTSSRGVADWSSGGGAPTRKASKTSRTSGKSNGPSTDGWLPTPSTSKHLKELEELTSAEIRHDWEAFKRECRKTLENQLRDQEILMSRAIKEHDSKTGGIPRGKGDSLNTLLTSAGDWVKGEYYYNCVTKKSQWDMPPEFAKLSKEQTAEQLSSRYKVNGSGFRERHEAATNGDDKQCDDPKPEGIDNRIGNMSSVRLPNTARDLQLKDFMEDMANRFGTDTFQCRVAFACANWSDWWNNLKEPPRKDPLARFVTGSIFEMICCLAIMTYSAIMIVSADQIVKTMSDEQPRYLVYSEQFFFVFFCLEVLSRLIVHRCYFFCNEEMGWNIFDLLLVLTSVWENLVSMLMNDTTADMNMTFLRSMRLMKMAKALRVLKMLRFISELRFMINSVMGSFVSLFWCGVMLVLMFLLFSLAFVQGVGAYFIQEKEASLAAGRSIEEFEEQEHIQLLTETFGSVVSSMLSCFRCVTGGDDWGMFYDILQPTGIINCIIFFFFIMFSEIALLNIVTGVFVDAAMKLGQPELNVLAFEQRKRDLQDAVALREVFDLLDEDGSGFVSASEFHQRVQDDRIKARLAVLGLSIKDASMFFTMLTEIGSNVDIDLDFFVDACLKMKGNASSIDLQSLSFETKVIHQHLRNLELETRKGMDEILDFICSRHGMGDSREPSREPFDDSPVSPLGLEHVHVETGHLNE